MYPLHSAVLRPLFLLTLLVFVFVSVACDDNARRRGPAPFRDTGGVTDVGHDADDSDVSESDTGADDAGHDDTGHDDTGAGDTGHDDTGSDDTGFGDTGESDTDLPPACLEGLTDCGGTCVDTDLHSDHCGGCGVRCGQGQTCTDGRCEAPPTACPLVPCQGFTYCEVSTGRCLPGCADDTSCDGLMVCDQTSRACVCPAPLRLCGGECVADSPLTCGDSCTECPASAGGLASCVDGRCELTCTAGYRLCGGACAPCPSGVATTCDGNACVADTVTCGANQHSCNGECVDSTSPATCGGRCTACPQPANATATCEAGACSYECNAQTRPCASGCCAWTYSTVDTSAVANEWITVTLDSQFRPHTAYRDSANRLRYAAWNGTSWERHQVPEPNSLLDATVDLLIVNSIPVIFYLTSDATYQYAALALYVDGIWDHGAVDIVNGEPRGIAGTVDPWGSIHVFAVSTEEGARQLRHIFYDTEEGVWYIAIAHPDVGPEGGWPSVTIDPTTGEIHLSYVVSQGTTRRLMYGYIDQGGWQNQVVATTSGSTLRRPHLALDAFRQPAIAYANGNNLTVYRKSATTWSSEVAVSGFVVESPSLAFDSNNAPYVGYTHPTSGNAMYAHKDAGTWQRINVNRNGQVTSNTALELAPGAAPYVGYVRASRATVAW